MPEFVSKEGVWAPRQEYVVDPSAPKGQEIYQGPDRAAKQMLEEAGVDHLGQHYTMDSELIARVRQMGFATVDEYLKLKGYNREQALAEFKRLESTPIDHKNPERKQFKKADRWGGQDTSGQGKHRDGGFEHPADAPASMAKPNADVPTGAPLPPRK